jgi:hypothetical protein
MTRLTEIDIETEADLEEMLIQSDGAQIGGIETWYIDQQGQSDHGKRFDILGLDEQGRTVVVELKRDRGPRDIVAQALDYASGIQDDDYADLERRYLDFAGVHPESDTGSSHILAEAHQDYFGLDEPLPKSQFNSEQRLVLVATEFRDNSIQMAKFLREYHIDIVAVEYSTYSSESGSPELVATEPLLRSVAEASTDEGSEPNRWQRNPEAWHRDQVADEQWNQFVELIDTIERETNLEPSWTQQNYVAFFEGRKRLVKINTDRTNELTVAVTIEDQDLTVEAIAEKTGTTPATISINRGSRWPIKLIYRPDDEIRIEEVVEFISAHQ